MADASSTISTTPASAMSTFPAPPRMFGDWTIDGPALSQWFKDLTAQNLVQAQTIGKLGGAVGDVNPADLPDPASSNVGTAQKTANDAYTAALAARSLAAKLVFAGSITISGAATSGNAAFAAAQPDTLYFVTATLSATAGAPASGATSVAGVTKTTTNVTIAVGTAPGSGNSVTFDVLVTRSPT